MQMETRRFLHDIVAEVFGLPKNKVIWTQQNGEKQAVPLVTLRAYSHQAEAREEIRPTGAPDTIDLRTPTAFVLEIRYFGKSGSYPVDIVDNFVRCLEKPTVVDRCFVNGVAFLYADPVQDITSLLGNGQQYEPAAAVDLHCRFTASVLDSPGHIEQVEITGAYDKTDPDSGGSDGQDQGGGDDSQGGGGISSVTGGGHLIYGHIAADGTVTDLDHAIPVNVSVSISDN